MQSVKNGSQVQTAAGEDVRIVRYLARGGQGEVYEAVWRGKKCAVKFFFQNANCRDVAGLVAKEPPHEAFVFPLAMLKSYSGGVSPGYVMPLVETSKFVTVRDLAGNINTTFSVLLEACCNFARAFAALSDAGLCYKDLSFDNLYFSPVSGEIKVIDPDNIAFDGSASAIDGTFGTMAPEIIRREASPSALTDLFSLSAVLFYILTLGGKALEGANEARLTELNETSLKMLYGVAPVYVFDPKDTSNRPVPGRHDRLLRFFALLPETLTKNFEKAFTVGLHHPSKRITERDWLKILNSIRDHVVVCSKCGTENFFDPAAPTSSRRCHGCGVAVFPAHTMTSSSGARVLVSCGTHLFRHALQDIGTGHDDVVAVVEPHPKSNQVLLFRNRTATPLRLTFADGETSELPAAKAVVLQSGLKISSGVGRVVVS